MLGGSFLQVDAGPVGASAGAAQAAAPENPLYTAGPLEIYAKCFRNATTTFGEIYVRTSENRSIMEGADDRPGGNAPAAYLNTNTAEDQRQLDTQTVGGTGASYNEDEGLVGAPDSTALNVLTGIGVKRGNFA